MKELRTPRSDEQSEPDRRRRARQRALRAAIAVSLVIGPLGCASVIDPSRAGADVVSGADVALTQDAMPQPDAERADAGPDGADASADAGCARFRADSEQFWACCADAGFAEPLCTPWGPFAPPEMADITRDVAPTISAQVAS